MSDGQTQKTMAPLADRCSLCGEGYHPNLSIDIADEAMQGEYRWAHDQCGRDHNRIFREAFCDE